MKLLAAYLYCWLNHLPVPHGPRRRFWEPALWKAMHGLEQFAGYRLTSQTANVCISKRMTRPEFDDWWAAHYEGNLEAKVRDDDREIKLIARQLNKPIAEVRTELQQAGLIG